MPRSYRWGEDISPRPRFRPSTKRYSSEKLLELVREEVRNHNHMYITAEAVATALRAKVHLVRQCFHQLNLEGLLGHAYNKGPHDSHRERTFHWNPWVSAWTAKLYPVHKKRI